MNTPPQLRFRRAAQPPTVWSPLDAFLYNLMTTNIAVFFGVPFVAGAAFYYPVRSLTIATLIAGAFCVIEALVYAFLVSSLPRNGGDYTFQSRLLSNSVGATFAFTGIVVGGALWMGIAGWFASRVAVGPFLVLAGHALHDSHLVAAGAWVMSTPGLISLGLIAVAWSAFITSRSMRLYARLQRVLVVGGLVAAIVLIAYFALTRLSVNVSTYRDILYKALEVGYRRHGHVMGWKATFALLPVVAFGLIYPGWVAFQSAEVRRAGELRIQMITTVGAKATAVLFAVVVLPLPIHHVGEELFGASVFLALNDPASFWQLMPRLFGLPTAPWLSTVILISLAVAINTWFWAWVPNHTLAASRVMLAMSWDRLLPNWVSDLHVSSRTPTKAILVFSLFAASVVLLYSGSSIWQLALHGTVVNLTTFTVTCLAASLFPFVHRELYRESTASPYEGFRIPLITIVGFIFVGFAVYLMNRYLSYRGPSGELKLQSTLISVAAMYAIAGIGYFLLHRYRHRHDGSDAEIFYRDVADE